MPAPPQFRAGEPQPGPASLGDVKWFDLFQDDMLRGLITESLKANYDIRIAAQRVHSGGRSTGRNALGAVSAVGRAGRRLPYRRQVPRFSRPLESLASLPGKSTCSASCAAPPRPRGRISWRVKENQKAVMQILVAQVASAYFDLREYDAEIVVVQDSIKTRQESVMLVKSREEGGVSSLLEVDQAKTLVYNAQANLSQLEQAREQTENLINSLLGKQPGPVARGQSLTDQPQPPQIPAGLPSTLLERRPDLRVAEQQLIAANARVGVAKAAFFPSINLTGSGGYQTSDLLGIANRTGGAYGMSGVVDLPIFTAGRLSGNYKTAKAQHEELLISYQKAINGAFHDVSDALVGYQKTKEYTVSVNLLAETLRDQTMLANARYVGGVSSYLEVLDTERQRLSAEQQLTQAQRDVLTSLVQLYKALGGGWQ